ncbi:farnesyl cysteine-carboxyl methyltransferase [Linderina macrospora]|uniref:Farnesyl cysteine-carboxyl methyltransferase n=1 Tax=Linderina macrospora TaxID=4868 RepID=A0ACC1J922_9FUNG|nr:farnesyl cysteine-carboxyl methyltransferase [Linderina macrospora]
MADNDVRAAAFTPEVGLFRRRPRSTDKWYTPIVALDYEMHSAHNIALTACGLGILIGLGLSALATLGFTHFGILGLYVALAATYHMLEYLSVAMYNPTRVTMESFMFSPDEGNHYYQAMLVSIAEYCIESYFCKSSKAPGVVTCAGLILAAFGQTMRTLAMVTAKSSFNHYIANRKESDHQLITHGVYRYERHPSYVGFFSWAVGLQIMLKNPVSVVGFAAVLGYFFLRRTRYEEHTLRVFFGPQYDNYCKRTGTLIPFVGDTSIARASAEPSDEVEEDS